MKTKNIFYSLFIVGLMAVFAYMVWAGTDGTLTATPSIDSPLNATNNSGSLLLNATITTSNVTNVTFYFNNSSSGEIHYNITISPSNGTTDDANSTFNATINTAAAAINLSDGFYNVSVLAENISSYSWNDSEVVEVQIDNTAPAVTINTLNNTYLGSITTTFVFNVTAIDTGTGIHVANLSNASGLTNESVTQIGTVVNSDFNRTVPTTELTEGGNVFTASINDTVNNLNNSETITVWLDTTASTVTLFTPNNYTWTTDTTPDFIFNFTDDTSINASCELVIDGATSITNSSAQNDTQTTITPTTALDLGVHNWTVNCTDLGGNTVMSSANKTIDVVAAPTLTSQDNNTWVGATAAGLNYTANGTLFNFSFTSDMVAGAGYANASCELWLTNNSGESNLGVNFSTLNGTATVLYNNETLMGMANQTWYINCTYNSTIITSETRNLNVDFTAPAVYLDTTQYLQNYTWTTDTTPSLIYNFTDGLSLTSSCELFVDETGRGINSSLKNNTSQTWTNTTALSKAVHTWYVNCTDLGSNVGTSLTQTDSFYLDVVNPIDVNMSTATQSGLKNNSNIKETKAGNVTFTFTFASGFVNSTADNNVSCELWISNASDGVFLANGVNTTALNRTEMILRNNQTLVNSVLTNWTINCSYNGTDITQVVNDDYWSMNVDNVSPTLSDVTTNDVTGSGATLKVTTSETSTCRYSDSPVAWDSMSTFTLTSGTTHSTGLSDLSSSTGYTYHVRCRDPATNEAYDYTKFTTSAEDSGSGGGGSSGGSSSGTVGDYAKEVWQSINAGETATIEVDNGEIGVTEVSFTVDATTYGAWVKVEKIDSLPSTVSAPASKVYKNVRITEMNVEKAMKGAATVDFKVAKSWLLENKVAKADVVLLRYKNDDWTELSTTMGADDGTYVHYTAQTPGFSYFVIGVKGGAVELTPEEAAVEAAEGAPAGEAAALEEEKAPLMTKKAWLWLIPIVVALAVVAYLIWFRKK